MPLYAINFNTGAEPLTGQYADLAAAKEAALDGAGFTQQNITIYDQHGEQVAQAVWYGIDPNNAEYPETVMLQFGTAGYYQKWDDEMID